MVSRENIFHIFANTKLMQLIASVLFSWYFIHVALIPNWIKAKLKFPPGKRLKPLDCHVCLSVWVAAALYFLPYEISQFITIAFGAGITSNLIGWLTRK
jgi:hypothetical protein